MMRKMATAGICLLALLTGCDKAFGSGDTASSQRQDDVDNVFGVYTGGDRLRVVINPSGGSAYATGVWTVVGSDKIADPINISNISCSMEEGQCTDSRAFVATGNGLRPTLIAADDNYRVVSWSSEKVVATNDEAEGGCRVIELTIDRRNQSVTTKTFSPESCAGREGALATPRIGRLISGKEFDQQRGIR
jgi:hypothetical protein